MHALDGRICFRLFPEPRFFCTEQHRPTLQAVVYLWSPPRNLICYSILHTLQPLVSRRASRLAVLLVPAPCTTLANEFVYYAPLSESSPKKMKAQRKLVRTHSDTSG